MKKILIFLSAINVVFNCYAVQIFPQLAKFTYVALQASSLPDINLRYICSSQRLAIQIKMPRVYAYHSDKSLLIITHQQQQLTIQGLSTVNTFSANLTKAQIQQFIKLARLPNSQLEIISYRANDSVTSQWSLLGLAEKLANIDTNCEH